MLFFFLNPNSWIKKQFFMCIHKHNYTSSWIKNMFLHLILIFIYQECEYNSVTQLSCLHTSFAKTIVSFVCVLELLGLIYWNMDLTHQKNANYILGLTWYFLLRAQNWCFWWTSWSQRQAWVHSGNNGGRKCGEWIDKRWDGFCYLSG